MNALVLFLVLTTSTLVLRSGDRIDVDGAVREKDGVITFRSHGALYSLPLDEVDIDATNRVVDVREAADAPPRVERVRSLPDEPAARRIAVTAERKKQLLEELERNHGGTPAPRQPSLERMPPLKTAEQEADEKREEWSWRREARTYEDALTRAKEELALLESRVEQLRAQILSFVSLGYKPEQFTYQSTQLERTLSQIPRAQLEVQRAQRDLERFREDARKQGVLPGWIRN